MFTTLHLQIIVKNNNILKEYIPKLQINLSFLIL